MYLSVTISSNAHTINEQTPSVLAREKVTPCSALKHSRTAYRGLVPMSPKTTPSAVIPVLRRESWDLLCCIVNLEVIRPVSAAY